MLKLTLDLKDVNRIDIQKTLQETATKISFDEAE